MKNGKKKADSRNYSGEIRLRLEAVKYYTQVDRLCQDLETISSLEIVTRTWSEKKGLEILVWLKDPVPLSHKLRQMTSVEEVYKTKKRVITVVLNNSLGGTTTPLIKPSDKKLFV